MWYRILINKTFQTPHKEHEYKKSANIKYIKLYRWLKNVGWYTSQFYIHGVGREGIVHVAPPLHTRSKALNNTLLHVLKARDTHNFLCVRIQEEKMMSYIWWKNTEDLKYIYIYINPLGTRSEDKYLYTRSFREAICFHWINTKLLLYSPQNLLCCLPVD